MTVPNFRAIVSLGIVLVGFHDVAAAEPWAEVVEQVRADAAPHEMLVTLCDDFGGRLTGSRANDAALDYLAAALSDLGHDVERVSFRVQTWERRADRVELLAPVKRPLRVAALAYSAPHRPFEAGVIDVGQGTDAAFEGKDVKAKVGLLEATLADPLHDIAQRAARLGIRALFQTNRVDGGQLLARTSSFQGRALPIPVYSITQEEARWLQRLCARGITPRVAMVTRSRPVAKTTTNLVVRIPGRSEDTIVVGAHFDSWDLGQGAIDNGLGIAQLFALAKALRSVDLPRTIELVWFNAEEQGLWGSRHEASRLGDRRIIAMINLDMVGVPIAVNALGDAELLPALNRWQAGRAVKLPEGVINQNWFGSDHTPYQLAGVRTITFNAPIEPGRVRYYHDMADTVDKVSPELVCESSAVIADLVLALAHDEQLTPSRRSDADTRALFSSPALERRLRSTGLWRWSDQAR